MTVKDFLKGFGKRFMWFPGMGGYGGASGDVDGYGRQGWIGGALPGSDVNWVRETGDPALNDVVAACLRWIGDNLPEPELTVVRKRRDGETVADPTHKLVEFIRRPNDEYDGDCLMAATASSYALSGNAYWALERNNGGQVARAWWLPHWSVWPQWPADGSAFITNYLYRPQGARGLGVVFDKKDIVHFRWGLDPYTGGRVGVHRTAPVYRSICSENEAATYTYSIMKNMGIVPYLFMPGDGNTYDDPATTASLRKLWQTMFTKDGRGKAAWAPVKIEVEKLGATPKDMALGDTTHEAQLRVCGAFGIPPQVVFVGGAEKGTGFDSGGQHNEARRAAYQDCLQPMCRRFEAVLTNRLLPEFDQRPSVTVVYDFSRVSALSEDETEAWKRWDLAVRGGWMKVSEARQRAGMTFEPSDEVYLRPTTSAVTEEYEELDEADNANNGSPPGSPNGAEPDDDAEDDGAED